MSPERFTQGDKLHHPECGQHPLRRLESWTDKKQEEAEPGHLAFSASGLHVTCDQLPQALMAMSSPPLCTMHSNCEFEPK